jgi:hypothetical protein
MLPPSKKWEDRITSESPDFRGADLQGEDFSSVDLREKDFRRSILRNAQFCDCDLTGSSFADADLSEANFRGAKLHNVDFSNANLSKTNFYKASLIGAYIIDANLYSTNFRESQMGQTIFANLDFDTSIGLDSIEHLGPSSLGVECLYRTGNGLPSLFLKGIGFSPILLDYVPSLVAAGTTIQFHSCFISYSHTDEAFARNLWIRMRDERIRVWYAPEDMKGGEKLYEQIDRAIHLHDKLLIVLSKSSISSSWVQTEIKRARRREKVDGRRKLFPIRLCDMQTLRAWECFDSDAGKDIAEEIREYYIPDFSGWQKKAEFEKEFQKLRRDLRQEGVTMRTH